MKTSIKSLALVVMGSLLAGAALAAPTPAVEVDDIETSFANQVTPITLVLTASLGLSVLVAVFAYIKRAAK